MKLKIESYRFARYIIHITTYKEYFSFSVPLPTPVLLATTGETWRTTKGDVEEKEPLDWNTHSSVRQNGWHGSLPLDSTLQSDLANSPSSVKILYAQKILHIKQKQTKVIYPRMIPFSSSKGLKVRTRKDRWLKWTFLNFLPRAYD